MMRIALISNSSAERDALRKALTRCLLEAGQLDVDIVGFDGMADFYAALARRHIRHFTAVLCCLDALPNLTITAQDGTATQVKPLACCKDLLSQNPRLHVVVASHQGGAALAAYQMGAAFLFLPGTYDDLRHAMRGVLSSLSWESVACLAVRTPGKVCNVAVGDIQFVESSKRGPIIHLSGQESLVARGTLKSLYEKLEAACLHRRQEEQDAKPTQPSGVLVMAGSSFIVNLDNVVASGKGALVFADGETVIVPVRRRKDIEQALEDYRLGRR